MLTELKAYSPWASAPKLLLDAAGHEETDLLQIRNIQGLDPVKAAVNTSPFGSVDGVALTGTQVPARNIVITIRPNPDWDTWTIDGLRQLLYLYFMPKGSTRLVFYDDEKSPRAISGIVESVEINPFSKDVEFQISIICPDPYFESLNPIVLTGSSSDGSAPLDIQYDGTIETGINLKVTHQTNPDPNYIYIQIGDPTLQFFHVSKSAIVNSTVYFVASSVPGDKYVRQVKTGTGVITNLLNNLQSGSSWPVLTPGSNDFSIITDSPGKQEWELTYVERFGGL